MNSETYIPPGHIVCGTCSICGGAVTMPQMWGSIIPPVPTCQSCGATAAQNGPVLPMVPSPLQPRITTTTGSDNLGQPQGPSSTHPLNSHLLTLTFYLMDIALPVFCLFIVVVAAFIFASRFGGDY